MKEVSMRFGVSIILSVAKQKERSDSNPKGIGDVTSRPQKRLFSPEFMRFAGCPAMVAARIDWAPIQLRKDCTWTAELLATTALLWAWSDELTLVDRFWAVRRIVLHLFPQSGEVANTYQAFTKILRRWTTELVGLLQRTLRERMQRNQV